jgi:hypothetical protein
LCGSTVLWCKSSAIWVSSYFNGASGRLDVKSGSLSLFSQPKVSSFSRSIWTKNELLCLVQNGDLILHLNLGCLHPVACVRSRWECFPSMHRRVSPRKICVEDGLWLKHVAQLNSRNLRY